RRWSTGAPVNQPSSCHRSLYLSTFLQPVTKEGVELRDGIDLFGGFFRWIRDAAKLDEVVVEQHVTSARVAVAGLTDAADVDHQLRIRQRVAAADLVRRKEPAVFSKDAGDVRVPLKGVAV